MSKNIVIQEGGTGKRFTANKLKANLVGGGTCLWVPEDETVLGTKNITENGTYKASDDGYYGYSEVNVNIPNVGTATGTDGDGDEVVAHPTNPDDPENPGPLITDKVPSRIEVVTPPTNPFGIYANGQTITTDGMVVKAYLASGDEYGTVPIAEIIIQPTTAVYDASTDNPSASSDLIDGAIPCSPVLTLKESASDNPINFSFTSGSGNLTGWGGKKYGASQTKVTLLGASSSPDALYGNDSISNPMNRSYTYDGKTVYFAEWYWLQSYESTPSQGASPMGDAWKMAWTMIYGEIQRAGGHQIITVSWPRPLDGKVLEATFEIVVEKPNLL